MLNGRRLVRWALWEVVMIDVLVCFFCFILLYVCALDRRFLWWCGGAIVVILACWVWSVDCRLDQQNESFRVNSSRETQWLSE